MPAEFPLLESFLPLLHEKIENVHCHARPEGGIETRSEQESPDPNGER
jgi:hypothetical protein